MQNFEKEPVGLTKNRFYKKGAVQLIITITCVTYVQKDV